MADGAQQLTQDTTISTMFLMMIQHPRWELLDLSNVRLVMTGGGACPSIVDEAFWEKGVEFKIGYVWGAACVRWGACDA